MDTAYGQMHIRHIRLGPLSIITLLGKCRSELTDAAIGEKKKKSYSC